MMMTSDKLAKNIIVWGIILHVKPLQSNKIIIFGSRKMASENQAENFMAVTIQTIHLYAPTLL